MDKATFTPANPTPLKNINVNDPKTPDNLKQLKNLINSQGVDGMLISGDKQIHFLYVPPAKKNGPVILMCNGKGASIGSTANLILEAQKHGMGIMLPEYSGNGESVGPLNEDAYFDSVKMGLTYLVADQRIQSDNILVLGYSMGTYFASKLAAGPIDLSKYANMIIQNNIDPSELKGTPEPEREMTLNVHLLQESSTQFKNVNLNKIILIAAPMGFKFVFDDIIKNHANTEAAKMSVNGDLLKTMETQLLYLNGLIKGKEMVFVEGNDDSYVNDRQPETLAKLAAPYNTVAILRVPGTHTTVRQNIFSLNQIFNTPVQLFNLDVPSPSDQIANPFMVLSVYPSGVK